MLFSVAEVMGVPAHLINKTVPRSEIRMWARYLAHRERKTRREDYLFASIVQELRRLYYALTATLPAGVNLPEPPSLDALLVRFGDSSLRKESTMPPLAERVETAMSALRMCQVVFQRNREKREKGESTQRKRIPLHKRPRQESVRASRPKRRTP